VSRKNRSHRMPLEPALTVLRAGDDPQVFRPPLPPEPPPPRDGGRRAAPPRPRVRVRRPPAPVTDGRLTIDNAPAEQAIRPLCIGRRNWLHLGGDGGLKPTGVLLSVVASVKRHGVNPWTYLTHVLPNCRLVTGVRTWPTCSRTVGPAPSPGRHS
jgi:hypothetical protein